MARSMDQWVDCVQLDLSVTDSRKVPCKLKSWECKFSSLFFLDGEFPHRRSCVYHYWKNQKLQVNTEGFSLVFIMIVQVQIYSKIFTAVYLQYTNGKLSRKWNEGDAYCKWKFSEVCIGFHWLCKVVKLCRRTGLLLHLCKSYLKFSWTSEFLHDKGKEEKRRDARSRNIENVS